MTERRKRTRTALWKQRTVELCRAQEHDLAIERLQFEITNERAAAAACRSRAAEFKAAAEELGRMGDAIDRLTRGLNIISNAGGIHGGAWCVAQARALNEQVVTGMDTCCTCHRCIKENDIRDASGNFPLSSTRMILCPTCGNKRCPKASDHRLACTGSNDPGQQGSVYS